MDIESIEIPKDEFEDTITISKLKEIQLDFYNHVITKIKNLNRIIKKDKRSICLDLLIVELGHYFNNCNIESNYKKLYLLKNDINDNQIIINLDFFKMSQSYYILFIVDSFFNNMIDTIINKEDSKYLLNLYNSNLYIDFCSITAQIDNQIENIDEKINHPKMDLCTLLMLYTCIVFDLDIIKNCIDLLSKIKKLIKKLKNDYSNGAKNITTIKRRPKRKLELSNKLCSKICRRY